MGQISTKFHLAVDDLKTSWYFKIYVVTWLLFAITTLSSLIILGQRATAGQAQPTWSLWIENGGNGLLFPPFSVRIADDENANIIDSVICKGAPGYLNLVPTMPCPDGSEYPSKCVYVQADHANPATQRLNGFDCYFNITAPNNPNADQVLLVQINETTSYGSSTTYIRPNANAWILLSKTGINDGTQPSEQFVWHTNLVYRTTVSPGDFFNVHFAYDTLSVFHWYKSIGFDTWLSVGGIGGFAFFMVILHTIVMWLIGLCLPNDSKFLHQSPVSDYQSIKSTASY